MEPITPQALLEPSFEVDPLLKLPVTKADSLFLILGLVDIPMKTEIQNLPVQQQELILQLEKIEKLQELLKRATRKSVKTFVDSTVSEKQPLSLKYHLKYTEKYHHCFKSQSLFNYIRKLAVKQHYKRRSPTSLQGEDVL